jgi:uncharacterized cupin superfamily protein
MQEKKMVDDPAQPRTAAIDARSLPPLTGTGYPEPFRKPVAGREKRRLGDAFGLTKFGVNLVRLPPGVMSSMRHWHAKEDEFVYVLEGELVLVTDAGEQVLQAGMVVGFPAGRPDGHHLINRSSRDAIYLEVGDRPSSDQSTYPDIDMLGKQQDGKWVFLHKDGTPY